jgi:hypothetical protein
VEGEAVEDAGGEPGPPAAVPGRGLDQRAVDGDERELARDEDGGAECQQEDGQQADDEIDAGLSGGGGRTAYGRGAAPRRTGCR